MRAISPWLLLLFLTILPAQAGHKPPKIILRVHVQTTGEGMPAELATTIALPPNGETIQIRSLPEVSEIDLTDVKQAPDGTVRLFFDHRGQVNLSAATAENQGRILVLMIDGYITYAPIIDQQITNGELDIPHPLSSQIVQLLQETARQNVRAAR
jgi:hypothetical protein